MRLYIIPLELAEANALVSLWHRHHEPLPIHRFSIGAIDGAGVAHGAAIINKPAARLTPPRDVVEVARLVTDGTPNACSILYAASARAALAMGYRRIQTYILAEEPGTSLIAAGWRNEGQVRRDGVGWDSRPGRRISNLGGKTRWSRDLATRPNPQSLLRVEATAQGAFDFGEPA